MCTAASRKKQRALMFYVLFLGPPILLSVINKLSLSCICNTIAWSFAQILPLKLAALGQKLEQTSWSYWETHNINATISSSKALPIPTVDVQLHRNNLSEYLKTTYGKDWRQRPLLLKGLWTELELQQPRNLSLEGLLQNPLEIPYFTDARERSLSPDHQASVRDIVRNITMGAPHKIGSQLVLENDPELIHEVAPLDIVIELFGEYFSADHIRGSGPFNLFPAITTVPLFIAKYSQGPKHFTPSDFGNTNKNAYTNANTNANTSANAPQPFTALHCEPIGNIAVQLSGQKKWTLVQPEYSYQIKPSISPDGRAFFVSESEQINVNVPSYTTITGAGDALWVPTWTWHRVDYIASDSDDDDDDDEISIAASLFHFRMLDFVRNNPLFAWLIVPSIAKELLGINTQ